jgi:SAM-dependent methyltransferase
MTYIDNDMLAVQARGAHQQTQPVLRKPGLDEAEYLRERSSPRPGDRFYLHLSDLRIAIEELRPLGAAKVLDYGCGGSPYRFLFGDCLYHRADLAGGDDLDFAYGPDAMLPPAVAGYDCVLSTQVLEHVEDARAYLDECRRVLRPGGHLIVTTHGLFEDHGCPYDYWRWTVYGLKRLIGAAGLEVEVVKKLTTGPRCALFLAEREAARLRFGAAGLHGRLISLGMRALFRVGSRSRLHVASDVSFVNHRVVEMSEPGHDNYVAIAIRARR